MFPPFGPFGRNFPTHCLGEIPFETYLHVQFNENILYIFEFAVYLLAFEIRLKNK
jgi:hypothetical protein